MVTNTQRPVNPLARELPLYFLALAADYDGTVADHGFVNAATTEALKQFKGTGRRLILVTGSELNGDHYEILSPAADTLAAKYPLAATLLLRAMIDFALKQGRVSRYRYAARHLAECASLASAIGDFGAVEPHERYSNRLNQEHSRKTSFWALVP